MGDYGEYSRMGSATSKIDDTSSYTNQQPASGNNSPITGDGGGGDFVQTFTTMPLMLTIVLLVYFLMAPIFMLKPTSLQSGSGFMLNQIIINSSLLVTFAVLYGMMTMFFPHSIVTSHQNILLPVVLISAMWIKSYITYQNNLTEYCKEQNESGSYTGGGVPYRWRQIVWNTSKVPIAILVTYVFIVLFPSTVVPFNQFFCGEEVPHPIVVFFSIGFWTGCASWAAESSCYFSLLRNGCQPPDKVDFVSIDETIRNYEKKQ